MTEVTIEDGLTEEAQDLMNTVAEALAELQQEDKDGDPEMFTEIIVEAMGTDAVLNAVYNGDEAGWFSIDWSDYVALDVQERGEKAESYGPLVYDVMSEAGLAKPEGNRDVGVLFGEDPYDVVVVNVLPGGAE